MSFIVDMSGIQELPEKWKEWKDVEIQECYNHDSSPSVFVIFDKNLRVHWCYSGNELRRLYLEEPDDYVSGPIEVPISEGLDKILTDSYENW